MPEFDSTDASVDKPLGSYRAAFDRYATCLAERGFDLAFVEDRGARIEYSVPAEAVDNSDADFVCYESEFRRVDDLWQVNNPDPEKIAFMERCLELNGIDIPESYDELAAAMVSDEVDSSVCPR